MTLSSSKLFVVKLFVENYILVNLPCPFIRKKPFLITISDN